MTITIENIEESKQRAQEIANSFSSFLHQNIVLTLADNEKSIARKIDILTSLKECFLNNIDIDSLPTNDDELNFINLISNITEQIQKYEIIIGRKDIDALRRAGQRLARKQRISMGIID
jgi:hypothetical protein